MARLSTRNLSWTLIDQGLSSSTNFALTLFAARSLSAQDFGGFALAFAGYLVFLGFARAVGAEPLAVRYSGLSDDRWRIATARSTGSSVLVGAGGAGILSVLGSILPYPMSAAFFAVAAFLPGLLLQDAWRYAFFARSSGAHAAANDAVWAATLAIGTPLAFLAEEAEAWHFMAIWGASGFIAGLAGIWQTGITPRPWESRTWTREHRDLIPRFAAEFAVLFTSGQLALYLVGGVAGLAAVGAIRAGQVILGPLNVLFMGFNSFAIPEAARSARRDAGGAYSVGIRVCVVLTAAVISWSTVVACVPSSIGLAILGRAWYDGRPLLLPVTVAMSAAGMVAGAGTILRGLTDARRSLSARLVHAVFVLSFATVGAYIHGALGGAWGLAIGGLCAAANWWRVALTSVRKARVREALRAFA